MQVFIEAQASSPDKHEYNEKTLEFKGIRTAIVPYPYPYGFILGTLTLEGEGVDCYVITQSSLEPGRIRSFIEMFYKLRQPAFVPKFILK